MCAADVKTTNNKNKTQEIKVSFSNENCWSETLGPFCGQGCSWILLRLNLRRKGKSKYFSARRIHQHIKIIKSYVHFVLKKYFWYREWRSIKKFVAVKWTSGFFIFMRRYVKNSFLTCWIHLKCRWATELMSTVTFLVCVR